MKSPFILLVLCIGAVSVLQLELAAHGLMGMSGYSVLIPLVATALLPFWQTLAVGVLNLAAAIFVYGFAIEIPVCMRVLVTSAVGLALGTSLVVCRVRVERERRLNRLMIARERLTLLSEAVSRVGSSLNVVCTAHELAEVAVPRFADCAAVDLFDSVLCGEEPATGPFNGNVTLRRVAQGQFFGPPDPGPHPGEEDTYPEKAVPARCMAAGEIFGAELLDDADAATWLAVAGGRAVEVCAHGPYSGIAVPLKARGVTLGVAVFIRHRRPEPFDADDLLFAEEIGARAAVCLDNARRYTHEKSTSLTLQHSLLPGGIHRNAAVEVATRYLPADTRAGVGGDWFDVIPLSGARVALVVGDVVGHGLHASATMGRLRAAVRTLADIDLPPDELLTHLDDIVSQLRAESCYRLEDGDALEAGEDGGELGATCLYAVYDPVSCCCTFATAGHPPPVLVFPAGGVEFLDLPTGPPLGVGGLPFESAEVKLPSGSLIGLYTDGLIESRRHDIDHGQEKLRQALCGPPDTLEATCDTILKIVLDEPPADDVALLIARTQELDSRHVVTWEVPYDPSAVARARELASGQLTDWGFDESATFAIELVVSELVTNAVRYGAGPIQLRLIRKSTLICEVSDSSNTAPHLRRARTFDEGGRGLFIVANLTQRWGTRHSPEGKTIWAELGPLST